MINLQLEPHDKKYQDVVDNPDWYMQYTTTREKEKEFITRAMEILKTKLKMSKSVAEKEINWFILQWGLTTNGSAESTEMVFIEEKTNINKRSKK